MKNNFRRSFVKPSALRRPEMNQELIKNSKKHRQLQKADGTSYVECEESLSKLQEISFTKYINQNLNSKPPGRIEAPENLWNGPPEEKSTVPGL